MIEWIVAVSVGVPLLVAGGLGLHQRRRQIAALRETGSRLDLEVIETTESYPKVEGRIDGIDVFVGIVRRDDKSKHVCVGVDPAGFPPEVQLTKGGPVRDGERRTLERLQAGERIRRRCTLDSTSDEVLEAMLENEPAMEAVWSMCTQFVHVRGDAGTLYLRLTDPTDTEAMIASVRDAVMLARRIEQAFEEKPLRVR